MLSDFLEKLTELIHDKDKVEVIQSESEPGHIYWLKHGNELERHEAEPRPRNHEPGDLASLIKLASDLVLGSGHVIVDIWVSTKKIVAILDAQDGYRERATLTLTPSTFIEDITKLGQSLAWMPQAQLVRYMRTRLEPTFTQTGIVEAFRRLKFRQASEATRVVEHGKSSIGKSLEAELTGQGSIPEHFACHVPAFQGNAAPISEFIRLLVEVEPANETIALIPEPGGVARFWAEVEVRLLQAVRQMVAAIDEESVRSRIFVYCGTP